VLALPWWFLWVDLSHSGIFFFIIIRAIKIRKQVTNNSKPFVLTLLLQELLPVGKKINTICDVIR
jgi:hypothetical protein